MADPYCHPELVSGSIFPLAPKSPDWMLKQHDGARSDEKLSYTRGAVHDEGMTADLLLFAISCEHSGARARAYMGANFVNFGHLDTAR